MKKLENTENVYLYPEGEKKQQRMLNIGYYTFEHFTSCGFLLVVLIQKEKQDSDLAKVGSETCKTGLVLVGSQQVAIMFPRN